MQRVRLSMPGLALALGFLLSLGLAVSATATEAEKAEAPAESAESVETAEKTYVPVTFAGMQVYVDQETGRLRPPTAEEAREMAQKMREYLGNDKSHAHSALVAKDGTISVVLGADHLNFSVAKVDADGQLHTDCVNGQDEAHKALEAAETPNEPKGEELQ